MSILITIDGKGIRRDVVEELTAPIATKYPEANIRVDKINDAKINPEPALRALEGHILALVKEYEQATGALVTKIKPCHFQHLDGTITTYFIEVQKQ